MTNKIPREQTEFVTPEGLLNFLSLFPGQATDSQQPGSKAYKLEIGITPAALQQENKVLQALSVVAQANDPNNWEAHVWKKLRTLDQMPGRDRAKYAYYEGMHVMSFSHVVSPVSLKMKDINLAIPEHRQRYDIAVNAAAPGAFKFCNPANPADLAKIEKMNNDRMIKGQQCIPESEYHKTTIPLDPHEIWSGCYGRVKGRVYWSANQKPATLGIGLSFVLFTREGERLFGESSADAAFSDFAPATSLAPQAVPQQFAMPTFPAPAAPQQQAPYTMAPAPLPVVYAPQQQAFPTPLPPQQQDPFKVFSKQN